MRVKKKKNIIKGVTKTFGTWYTSSMIVYYSFFSIKQNLLISIFFRNGVFCVFYVSYVCFHVFLRVDIFSELFVIIVHVYIFFCLKIKIQKIRFTKKR